MLKHLDYLMISNGGCDPFHYIKGNGGLGYKPSPPFMHGLGYDYNLIDGSGFNSYKNKFNTSHELPKDESHTLDEISKLTGYSKKGLQTIYCFTTSIIQKQKLMLFGRTKYYYQKYVKLYDMHS
jgi:hypothetical protein